MSAFFRRAVAAAGNNTANSAVKGVVFAVKDVFLCTLNRTENGMDFIFKNTRW
jgi:hypothetical protein